MRIFERPLRWTKLCVYITCCSAACLAQTLTTGRIVGTVRDAQGAAIVHAKVVAVNMAGEEERSALTDEAGNYVLNSMAPSTYHILITANGFAGVRFDEVRADISNTVTVNASLKVADVTSEVTVLDAPPLVQSENSEVQTSFAAGILSVEPLATRNFLQLATLAPGVSTPLVNNNALGRNSPNFSVNGARTSQNNLQINGIDANDISAHDFAAVPIPAPETIGELVVKTSMYDASVGGAGGSVQVITKSGTNSLHGGIYGYFRNTSLDANDPNLKSVGLGRPELDQGIYGATFGGALRRNRAFFFLSYQGTHSNNGATDQSLYKSVLIAPGLTDDRSAATLMSTFKVGSIDPVSLQLLNTTSSDGKFLIPTPQTEDGRVTGSAPSTYHEEQFNANLDLYPRTKDSLAAKLFVANAPQFWALGGSTFSGGSSLPGFGTQREINNRVFSLREIHTFSATAVNEARLGYNFVLTNETPQESLLDSDVGISRPTAATFPGLPLILLARNVAGASVGSSPITLRGSSPSLSLVEVFSTRHGKHDLRGGGEFRHYRWDVHANVNAYGEIDFPCFKQFLLGNSDFSSIGVGLPDRNFRASDYALFAQDDWKVTQKLTLNLGLRYELDLPAYDTKGRIGGFDPALYKPRLEIQNGYPLGPPVGGIVMAGNAIPQYDLAGVPKVTNSVLKSIDPNNLGPRVGFAWSPLNKSRLVVRGGYGIFYSRPSFIYLGLDFFAPPFYATFLSFGQTFANPFPSALPAGGFPLLEPGVSLTGTVMDRSNRVPYFQQFNTSVEYQFARDTVLQAAYVGSRGVRLYRSLAVNQAAIASSNDPITNAVTGDVIVDNTPENAPLRAPFQGTDTSFFNLNQTTASSTYASLQVTLNRRAAHGVDLRASYTFSKSIDNASNAGGGAFSDGSLDTSSALDTGSVFGNQFSAHTNRGLSDFDRTHRLVLDWVWDVPRAPWAAHSRIGKTLFSNWHLSGIVIAMSGLPIDVLDPNGGDLYGLTGTRPNWAPGASSKTASTNVPAGYSFNPFAFSLPIVQPNQPIPSAHNQTALAPEGGNDIGNVGRNVLRGPAQSNVDLSIAKQISVSESGKVEVRVDFFNALNHANRSNPISDITNASFDSSGFILSPGDFGRSLSFDSSPRIVQMSVRLQF